MSCLFKKRKAYILQNFKIRKYIFMKSSLNCIRCKSYYQVLGLNSNASSKDIKSAYYELSLKFHPDKNDGSPESVEKFREITEAYEVLGNPQKRLSYDQGKDFSSSYSQNSTTKDGYYYKPYYSKQRPQGPYTGKTKDFNYDEHFRQHYEKQRMYEYEYIKRRWGAEFRRRYPDRNPEDEYYRNPYHQHERTSGSKSREEFYKARREFYEEYSKLFSKKFQVLYFFLPFWIAFLIIPFLADMFNPEKYRTDRYQGPIYYKIKNENDDERNDE